MSKKTIDFLIETNHSYISDFYYHQLQKQISPIISIQAANLPKSITQQTYICNASLQLWISSLNPTNTFDVSIFKNSYTMKRTYFYSSIIAGLMLLSTATQADAQAVSNSGESLLNKSSLKQDSANTFISFSPVYLDGKTYVRWLVKNDKKDGVFVVERSENGTDFEALGFRDRVGTKLLVNLFYSFVDEEPLQGDNHYRVMQVGADNTYRYSSVVKVKTPVQPQQVGSSANVGTEIPLESK